VLNSRTFTTAACLILFAGCVLTPSASRVQPAHTAVDIAGHDAASQPVRFHARSYEGLRQHTFSKVGSDLYPTVSPDGRFLAFASNRHSATFDLYLKNVDGTTITQLTSDPGDDIQPAFSPNGKFLAFASNRNGNWDVFVLDLARQKSLQITDSPQHDVSPGWSADGLRMVYASRSARTGEWELWLASLQQPGKRLMIGPGLFPRWHPSSNQIAFQRPLNRGQRWFSIWSVQLAGPEIKYPTQLVADRQWAAISPCWGPGGRRLAYATVDKAAAMSLKPMSNRGNQIYVVDADGTGQIRLTDGPGNNWSPCWAADGRVYFVSDRNKRVNIWSVMPVSRIAQR